MLNELKNMIEENIENPQTSVELRVWEEVKEVTKYLTDNATDEVIALTKMLVKEKRRNAKNHTEWIWADVEEMMEEL